MDTEMKKRRYDRGAAAFCAFLAAVTLVFAVTAASLPSAEEAGIYTSVVRLHVIAASDSDGDQALKLRVRDAVLETLAPLIEDCGTVEQAEDVIRKNADRLLSAAEAVVSGSGQTAVLTLTDEHYPAREYGGITLPAGTYRSLRIILGEGRGHNWWCVLFPQLCTAAAEKRPEVIAAGFTPGQIRILSEGEDVKYTVKLKLLEIVSELLAR